MKNNRLKKQIDFIVEIDKLKNVYRQTFLMDGRRKENDAEHSWHITMMALLLSEHARGKKLNILRVFKILLIHDLVEIDAGDTFIYDIEKNRDKSKREKAAADRIFNILPADQADEFHGLWQEFEEGKSPESKFAASLDRLQPLLQNYITKGKAWKYHNIHSKQVIERNKCINEGSSIIWEYAKELINDSVNQGYLKK